MSRSWEVDRLAARPQRWSMNAVLGGNVGNSFPIRWRMWLFYFLAWLQRHHPIAKAYPRTEESRSATIRADKLGNVRSKVGTIVSFVTAVYLTSCVSVSQHQFSQPASGWQTKTGQLMYRTAKATLIGEALVRFSKTGDFELTVSKGPGITLLSLRQDASFAEFNANFTGQRWSGPTTQAPSQLRGWLGLRDQFLRSPNQKTLRYVSGDETFLFHF
jgi:hypothetical protein